MFVCFDLCYQARSAIHQISINLSQVYVKIRSFVVYKNFVFVAMAVVAIAMNSTKTQARWKVFCTTSIGYYFIFGYRPLAGKCLRMNRKGGREKEWKSLNMEVEWGRYELRWIRSRWKVLIEYEILEQNDLRVGLSDFALAQLHHHPWNLFAFASMFFVSLFL